MPYSAPQPTEDTNWKVSFIKPNEVTVVGSWPTKLSVKAKDKKPYRVDVAVEMPVVSFFYSSMDYHLNDVDLFRLFSKRRTISMADSSTNAHITWQWLPLQLLARVVN